MQGFKTQKFQISQLSHNSLSEPPLAPGPIGELTSSPLSLIPVVFPRFPSLCRFLAIEPLLSLRPDPAPPPV
jgi:hypothetical protein